MRLKVNIKSNSTTAYILRGLIPYTEENINFVFKPSIFFNELEKLNNVKVSSKTIKTNYYRLIKNGYVERDKNGSPRLTELAKSSLNKFEPKKLSNNAKLLLIFDIPENDRYKRDRLRTTLKELKFKQVQKSVWVSDYDSREYLKAEIIDQKLEDNVVLYESDKIKI